MWVDSTTPLPTACGGAPTPTWPTTGMYATPTPTGACSYNNHECNPFCTLNNWEGGEMWKQISTVGYKNIIVEFDVFASGLSDLPHGFRPWGQGYNRWDQGFRFEENDAYRPYQYCNGDGLDLFQRCPDTGLIEETLTICYTAEYEAPYTDRGVPVFTRRVGDIDVAAGIAKWTVGKMIPREVLKEDYTAVRKVVLDFSSRETVDNNPFFGIWLRCQLDSPGNTISIDNIKVYGQRN